LDPIARNFVESPKNSFLQGIILKIFVNWINGWFSAIVAVGIGGRLMKVRLWCLAFMVLLGSFSLSAEASNLLQTIDQLKNFDTTDLSCSLTVLTTKANGEKSRIEARYFRRDRDDKFTMILTGPDSKIGQGYLQIADNLWFYDPETRAFAHSSLKENFQDSKARNDDFSSSSYATDYSVEAQESAKLGAYDVHVLTLKANTDLIPYARQKLWVRKDIPLILKQECYARSGKLMVTYAYPAYTREAGKYVPSKIFIRDELVKGENTEISLSSISLGNLDSNYFTKGFLERSGR